MIRLTRPIVFVLFVALFMVSCGGSPETGDAFASRGFRALYRGDYERAAADLEMAVQKGLSEQKEDLVYTCLGNAYNELEAFEKSIEAHKKALEVNPECHEAWVNLGIVYRLTDEFSKAEECYNKALELQPDYAELHASIGALHIHQDKYDLAVEHLEKATRLDKQLPVAWSNLALAYATVGRFDEADAAIKKAVVLGYKNGPIIQERIDNLKAMERE